MEEYWIGWQINENDINDKEFPYHTTICNRDKDGKVYLCSMIKAKSEEDASELIREYCSEHIINFFIHRWEKPNLELE